MDEEASMDEEALRIKSRRLEQNVALANRDFGLVASFWTDDVSCTRALGQVLVGKDALRDVVSGPIIFQRIPVEIEPSKRFPRLAWESGKFEGREGTKVVLSGRYAAQWVKKDGGEWLIRSEVFVALDGDE